MKGYSVKIRECSEELSVRDKIKLKDLTNAYSIDELSQEAKEIEEHFIIDFASYAVLDIHNENADDKDYTKYVVISKAGEKYETGSKSFFTGLMNIVDEMLNAGETDFQIEVIRKESKNYKGKEFITCILV